MENVKFVYFSEKLKSNIPFHTEFGKFRNIQYVNHGEEVIIFMRLSC